MHETNFKNWLFGISLHNNPEVLYHLFKALESRQTNEYFEVHSHDNGFVIRDTEKKHELLLESSAPANFLFYLKENYCSGQNIEDWYKAKALYNEHKPLQQNQQQMNESKTVRGKKDYLIHPKERMYSVIMTIITVIFWIVVALAFVYAVHTRMKLGFLIAGAYVSLIVLAIILKKGFLIGILRGNGIRVTGKQFPDIYETTEQLARKLELTIPDVYILESGGLLNAFATKFMGNSFLVLYSDIVDACAMRGNKSLQFIIGHELAHIKRRHLLMKTLLFPAYFIPFLGQAYSRACEYTCDKIGYAVSSPESAQHGLLLLAGGKSLYNQIDVKEYISNYRVRSGFWTWFTEKFMSHPHLTKRLDKLFIL